MPASDFTQTVAKLKAKYQRLDNLETVINDTSKTSTTKYPNTKAVADYVDAKAVQSDYAETDNTKPSFIKNKPDLDDYLVTVEKQASAEAGFAATYFVKQDGVKVGDSINIPMDYLVKKAEVKTCTTPDVPVSGLFVGDKYIDFTVNVKVGTATDEHIYIAVNDFAVAYTFKSTSKIEFTVSSSHDVSATIAVGGVDTAELASDAVTSTKLANSSVETAKIADAAVENAKLAADAVQTVNIKDANVTLSKMAANSVDSSKVVDASLVGEDIALETISGGDATTKGNIKPSTIKTYNLDTADIYASIDAALAASIEAEG